MLKIFIKEENLKYLKNMYINGQSTGAQLNPDPVSYLYCIDCKTSLKKETKCNHCQQLLCQNCSKQCPNKSYNHTNNYYCKSCVTISCILCRLPKNCKTCVQKCFYSGCEHKFCSQCYDKNKHQIRTANTNCQFYKCDNCNTDTNCILTTIYCSKCDRRICNNCFYEKHQHK